MTNSQHLYEIRPRKDKRGADLISDVLPFGRLLYGEPNAIQLVPLMERFPHLDHVCRVVVIALAIRKENRAIPWRDSCPDCARLGVAPTGSNRNSEGEHGGARPRERRLS